MIRTAVGFLGLLALLPALQAQDKAEKKPPAEQYQALVKEFDTAQKDFQKAIREAKTPKDKQKVFQEKYPRPDKFAERFLELAEKNPKDPAAIDALGWIVSKVRVAKSDPKSPRTKALKMLLQDHVQSEKIASVCPSLGNTVDEDSKNLLQAVLDKNKHRPTQAQALLAMAQRAETRQSIAKQLKEHPEAVKNAERVLGKEFVETLVKAGPDKLRKEVEDILERVAKDYADVPDPSGDTLGEVVKDKLDGMRHPIIVDKPAPEISGRDIDGKKFKLSDYRGKVVLLDFWGNW